MSRILGIDYGLKRTGIAVTDPLQIIVTPLETIETSKLDAFLKNYIENENVEKIVIGYPLKMDGNKTDITDDVEQFYKKTQKIYPSISFYLKDERLTSKMASKALVDGGFKKKKRKEKGALDKISAVFILKSFLNSI